ncbi:hypothetical protein Mmc1_1689 [Magnetococcus marinus MC-1]|uniref:Terminase small subunit n=1 Tax=Magnetococcus marinus (strain ATCC BAA-1437 / JCM 17883 / MC-1) TaxID=156889 RepID=A0L8A5_MAGMM|nr:hypothetical protein [Magnetococcus marinus]ABK44198.1 hypothetical protein Mmc1_1689 [Magnetococcus marinus MC-1]
MAEQNVDWLSMRMAYEQGATVRELVKQYGGSSSAIYGRMRREAWMKTRIKTEAGADVITEKMPEDPLQALAPNTEHPLLTAPAQDEAMLGEKGLGCDLSGVIQDHRETWLEHKKRIHKALNAGDLEQIKLLKLSAEAFKICQENERKAWGMDAKEGGADKAELATDQQCMITPTLDELKAHLNEERSAMEAPERASTHRHSQ